MHGLPQAVIIAKNLLAQCLDNYGNFQVKNTPLLWRHVWHPILFKLIINDFGIGYVGFYHSDHIMSVLKMYYENITTYLEGLLYWVIIMKWDDAKWYFNISIPGYLNNAIHQFNNEKPKNSQHKVYPSPQRTYGADSQNMKPINTSPVISAERVK